MATRRRNQDITSVAADVIAARTAELSSLDPVAGIPGPGRWLVAEYLPTALFSLKISVATSSVGRSLVVPTPYTIKMALVDAAFRSGLSERGCADFLRSLVGVDLRISPPEVCVVTHTLVKIRQESRDSSTHDLYTSAVAYREFVHHHGRWRWAFDLAAGDAILAERLVTLTPHLTYVGKRGSFVQFVGLYRSTALDLSFTQIPDRSNSWQIPARWQVVPLDDFGPDATLETPSSPRQRRAQRGRHRSFTHTVVPLGITNTGPGFTEYQSE